jgi:tetratricopeptide (TPR) repeat protein
MMKQLPALLLCAALLAGCGDMQNDAADEKNELVSKGLELAQLKQWDDAIRNFEVALADNAQLARPDLELALIYHQQKNNYIRAVYHYERYLEKRPDSEKQDLINGWVQQAKISLAAEIGQSDEGISKEMVRLQRENDMLRRQLARGGAPRSTRVKTLLTEPPPKRSEATKPVVIKPAPTPVS